MACLGTYVRTAVPRPEPYASVYERVVGSFWAGENAQTSIYQMRTVYLKLTEPFASVK